MKFILAIVAAFTMSACGESGKRNGGYPEFGNNQEKRQEIFLACLKALPAGPATTKYNDWDEVVKACDSAAWGQSRYCVANCPPLPTAVKP